MRNQDELALRKLRTGAQWHCPECSAYESERTVMHAFYDDKDMLTAVQSSGLCVECYLAYSD